MSDMPNPFEFAASDAAAEQAAASSPVLPPVGDVAATLIEQADLDDISCIGEIFAGARKLEYVPNIFELDPAAITAADHLLYDVLKAMVDPRVPGLREIPDEQALFEAIEPPPLFLQAVGY